MRFFRARSLILSPSKRSMARHLLPSRPALKSLSGSGRLAPLEKVIFTLSLCALPTAIIPSRDHTGLPIHFHSSIISRSASRMVLRRLARVLPRQSLSDSISRSIRSDGFIGSLCLPFLHEVRSVGYIPAHGALAMLKSSAPFFIVDDLGATIAFYHSKLRFDVLHKGGGDGDRD